MDRATHFVDNSRRPAPLAEHTRVRLLHNLPKSHLRAGHVGTIVHMYRHGVGLEVEFRTGHGASEVVTLPRDAVELADG